MAENTQDPQNNTDQTNTNDQVTQNQDHVTTNQDQQTSVTPPEVCKQDEFQGIRFYDGVGYGYLRILPDKIELLVGENYEYAVDTSIAHTFRVTGKNKDVKVYMDGKLVIDASGQHTLKSDQKLLEFGAISAREQSTGSAWTNFKYSVDGAYEPNENSEQVLSEIMTFPGGGISAIKSFKNNLYVSYEPDDPAESACIYRYEEGYTPENRSTIALTKSNVTSVLIDPNRSGNLFGTSGKFIGTDRGIQYLVGSKPYPWDYVMNTSELPQESGWKLSENCVGNCYSLFNRVLTVDTTQEQDQSTLKFIQDSNSFWDRYADNKIGWTVEVRAKVTNDDASLDRTDVFTTATDYVFVLDNSDDVNQTNVKDYRNYLFGTFINSLGVNDTFNVIVFNSDAASAFPDAVLATGDNISLAKSFVAELPEPSGEALVENAMSLALSQTFINDNKKVILLGSGQISDPSVSDVPSNIKTINDSGPLADIFTVSLGFYVFNATGGDAKKKAYREIAEFNNGQTFLIQDTDAIEQRALEIWKTVDASFFDWMTNTAARQYSIDPRAAFSQNVDKSCLPGVPPAFQELDRIPPDDGINAPSVLINDGQYEEVVQFFEKGIRLKYARTFAKVDLSREFSTIRIIGRDRAIAVFVKADSEAQFKQVLFAPNALFVKANKRGSQESPHLANDQYGLSHAVWADSKNDNWGIYYSKKIAKNIISTGRAYSISQNSVTLITQTDNGESLEQIKTENSVEYSVLSVLLARISFGLVPSAITSVRANALVCPNANFKSTGVKAGDKVVLSNLLDANNQRVSSKKTTYTVLAVPDEAVLVLDTSEELNAIFSSCEYFVSRGENAWANPIQVSNQSLDSTSPFVLPHSSGEVYVAYENNSNGPSDIYMRRGKSGATSSSFKETARITHGTGLHRRPLLAELEDGKILLVWENNRIDRTRSQIYYTIIDPDSFGSVSCYDFVSLTPYSEKAQNPTLASCGGKIATAAYEDIPDPTTGKSEIFVASWDPVTQQAERKQISTGDGNNYNPSITTCGSQIKLVWENDASGLREIMLASGFCSNYSVITTEDTGGVSSGQLGQTEIGFTVSDYARQYGFVDADSNGGVSHAFFYGTFGMNPVDFDASGRIMSLAVTGFEVGEAGIGKSSETAGAVFISGHDSDYHAYTPNSSPRTFLAKAINFVTQNKTSPRLLYVTSILDPHGDEIFGGIALTAMGYNYDVADAFGSGPHTFSPSNEYAPFTPFFKNVLDLRTVKFSDYDAVVVASDYGSWLRQEELDILVLRRRELLDYVTAGGGLLAFAESGSRQPFPPFPWRSDQTPAYPGVSRNLYGFVPFLQSSIKLEDVIEVGSVAFKREILQITDSRGNSTNPSVACNEKGDIYICFEDDRVRKDNGQIYISRYNPYTNEWLSSNQVGLDVRLNLPLPEASRPQVSFDTSDEGVLLFQAIDETNNSVIGSVSLAKIDSGSNTGLPSSLLFGPNISSAATSIVDSVYSTYVAANAFDGNSSTYWSPIGTGDAIIDTAYIGQHFSEAVEIARVQFYTHPIRLNNIASVKVQFSDDGIVWVDAVEQTNLPDATAQWVYIDVPKSGDHKYWRITPSSGVYIAQHWFVAEFQMMAYVDETIEVNEEEPIVAYFPLEDSQEGSNQVVNRIRNSSGQTINGVASVSTDQLSVEAPLKGVSWFNPVYERAFDLDADTKVFSVDSSFVSRTGAVDLWMTPHWASSDTTGRVIFGNTDIGSTTENKMVLGIEPIAGGSALCFSVIDNNGVIRKTSIKNDGLSTNFSWNAEQPVHLRATWDEAAIGISTMNSVSFANDSLGIAVGSNGAIFRTTDSGATWTKIPSGLTLELYSVDFLPDGLTAFVGGEVGTVLSSVDGGLTWTIMENDYTKDVKSIFYDSVSGILHIAGSEGLLAWSNDAAVSWTDGDFLSDSDLLSIAVVDDGITRSVVAVGANGTIIVSTNDGVNYTPYGSNFNVDFNFITRTHQAGPYTSYIGGNKGTVLRSTDSGMSWNDCSLIWSLGYQPNVLSLSHNNDFTKVYVVGQNGSLAVSSDSGTTWAEIKTAMLNGSFNCIDAWHGGTATDYVFVVGSGGSVMVSDDGGITQNYYLTRSGNVTLYVDGKEPDQERSNDGPFSWSPSGNLFFGDYQFGGSKTANAIFDEIIMYRVIPNGSINKRRVYLEKLLQNVDRLIDVFAEKRIEFGSLYPTSKSRSHWNQFNIFVCGAKEPVREFSWTAQLGVQDDIINDMAVDTSGYLWAATENGVCQFDIKEVNDDIERWINGQYAKPNGSKKYQNYNGPACNFANNSTNAVMVDPSGNIWAGTENGLLFLEKSTIEQSSNEDPVAAYNQEQLNKTSFGQGDVVNEPDVEWQRIEGLPSDKITALASDEEGKIMVGTDAGVAVINKNLQSDSQETGTNIYTVTDGLPSNFINCIFYDRYSAEFWIGTDNGIARFDKSGYFNTLSASDGLVSNNVFSISAKDNKKYIGTDAGITVIEGNLKYSYLPSTGIGYGAIADIATDDFGSIWFATSSGLVQLDESCAHKFVLYDYRDGIVGDATLVPYQRYRIIGGPVPKGSCNKALIIVSVNNERMLSGYTYNEEGPYIIFDEPRSASDKVEVCIHAGWRKIKCFDANDNGGEQIATVETERLNFNVYRKAFSAGTVSLGGNHADGADTGSSMYFVIASAISGSASVIASVSPSTASIEDDFSKGSTVYSDLTEEVQILPTTLRTLQYIATPSADEGNMSENDYLSFELSEDAIVYVAYDAKATSLPGWLRSFTPVQATYRVVDMDTFTDASGEEKLFVALRGTNGCVYEIVNEKDACDISDSIALDSDPPDGCAYITKINSPTSVTLSISAADAVTGVTDMQVSTRSDFSDVSWVPFQAKYILAIPPATMSDVTDVFETTDVVDLPSTATFTIFYQWQDKLLIATENPGRVYEINPSTLELTLLFDTGETRVISLATFGDYLLVGTGNNGRSFYWDGTTLHQLVMPGGEAVSAITVFDFRAFFGTYPEGKVYEMDQYLNISLFMDTYENSVNGFAIFNNKLYWVTSNEQIAEGDVLTTTTTLSHRHSIICPSGTTILTALNGTTTTVDGHNHAIVNGVVQTANAHTHNLNGSRSGKVFRYDPTGNDTIIVHSDKDYSITAICSTTTADTGLMFIGTYPNGKILRFVSDENLFIKSFDTPASTISALRVINNTIFAAADEDLFEFDGRRWLFASAAESQISDIIQVGDSVLMIVGTKVVRTSVTTATTSPSQRNICAFVRFRDAAGNVTKILDDQGNVIKCYNPCTLDQKDATTTVTTVTTETGTTTTSTSTTKNDGTATSNIPPVVHRLTEFNESATVLDIFDGSEAFYSGDKVTEDVGIYESEIFNGTTSLVQWVSLSWFADAPTGTSITFAVRSASTRSAILDAAWSEEFTSPTSNDLTNQMGQYLQFRATLKVTQAGTPSPELYKVDIQLRTSQAVHFFTTNFVLPDDIKRGILTHNSCINPPVTDIVFGISGQDSVDFSEYYPIVPNKVFELPTEHQRKNLRVGIKLISSPQTVPVVDEFALLFSLANDAIIRLNLAGMPTETAPEEILGSTRTVVTDSVQGHTHTITFNVSITEKTAINGTTSINAGHSHEVVNGIVQISAQHNHNFEI